MGQFFDTYPKLQYDFLGNGKYQEMPNILRQVRENKLRVNSAISYQWAEVGEMRPDQLSTHLYGSPIYHWTFFIINEHLYEGERNWPLASYPFELMIAEKYNYHTIRLYRDSTDDIEYNRIDDRFACGAKLIGLTTSAVATVKGRDLPMNTLRFTYDGPKQFVEHETIYCIEESDWYANGWDSMYAELKGWDSSTLEEALYYSDINLIDIITDKYDVREGQNTLHHWFDDKRGYNYTNYENIDFVSNPDANISFKTNREYEEDINDERGNIRVVRPQLIERFASEYKRLINE